MVPLNISLIILDMNSLIAVFRERGLAEVTTSEEACQGVTASVRPGNFIHLLDLGQKNPSEL